MALTPPQKTRLFQYLLRDFSGVDSSAVIAALFDTLFMTDLERRTWLVARTTAVRARLQQLFSGIDAETATAKTSLTAEINDLTTIEGAL